MLARMPASESWLFHVRTRFAAAVEIQLVAGNSALVEESARVFVPDLAGPTNIQTALPDQSLRSLVGKRLPTSSGWIRRDDLFQEAATWLCGLFESHVTMQLICEAGYQHIGDPVLAARPHIVLGGRPFLAISLEGADTSDVASVLRWGRSWRFLGIVAGTGGPADARFAPRSQNLFLCDAFDADSLLVVSLAHQRQSRQ